MPATQRKPAPSVQEQTLEAIRESQQAVVHAAQTWAESVQAIVPSTPALPFGDQLPSPQEIVKTSFDFAEELLKSQREFTERLFAAYGPIFEPKRSDG